jgi:hypothetical protein
MSFARVMGLALLWGQICGAVAAGQPLGQSDARPQAATAPVRGRVVEAGTGLPIPGALVRVIETDASVLTGADGAFVLALPAVPPATVQVVMVGFALLERRIDPFAASETELTLALSEAPPSYAEQVDVKGQVFPVGDSAAPTAVTIGAADLALLRGVLADDPFRAVQAMPGVATGDDFNAEFSIRGSGEKSVGVLVDGVPATVALHTIQGRNDTGSVSMLNSDLLQEVTVSGGSYLPRSGNRTGAQVEFLTRDGARDRTQVRGVVGAAVASLVAEGPLGRARRGSWLVAGRGSYAGWIARRIDPDTSTTFTFVDTNARLSWDLSAAHRASLVLVAGRMFVEERNADNSLNSLDRGLNESVFALGTWRWQVAPRLTVTQKASGIYNRFRNLNRWNQELGRGRVAGGGYRAAGTWIARDGLVVEGGGSVDIEHRELLLNRVNPRPPIVTVLDGADDTDHLWGGYGIVTATPWSRVTVSGGVRADASTLAGWGVVAPFGSAAVELGPAWRVRAGGGQYAQFASVAQLTGQRGTPGLRPTEATHADLAIEWRPKPDLRWQAAFYQRTEEDGLRLPDSEPRIVNGRPRPASQTTTWQNRLETTSHGIELLAQRRRPIGVSGWVSYAYALTRERDVVTDERFHGDYDQRHTLNVYVSWRASHRTGASLKYRYGSNIPVRGYYDEGPQADGEPTYVLGPYRNVARLPAYSRLDARVQQSFIRGQKRLTVFAEAVNLLNRDNFGPGSPGRAESLFPVIPSAGLLIEF